MTERSKDYSRRYYAKHRAKVIARCAQRVREHPVEHYACTKKWAKANPEAVAAKFKRWYEKNKPANATRSRKRRERLRNVESTDAASSTVLAQIISSCARMKCSLCGKNMPKSDRTIDHVIPIAKGGTGHIANLQVVHLRCNCSKRSKTPDQITGQHEMNFAGNRAHLNVPSVTLKGVADYSTANASQLTKNT